MGCQNKLSSPLISSVCIAIIITIAILIDNTNAYPASPIVKFYRDSHYKGEEITYTIDTTSNDCTPRVPTGGVDTWSSVKVEPEGLCVELFTSSECHGESEHVTRSTPEFKILNDKVLAFKICGR